MTKFTKLPPLLLDTMAAMKVINNVPEEMAIQAVLGVVNFATHAHYDVDPVFFGGNTIPTTEYFLALAPTAGAKSTVYKMLSSGIKRFEEDEKVRLGNDLARYDLEMAIYKKEFNGKLKDLTEIDKQNPTTMAKLAEELKEPEKPRTYNYRIKSATVNGMIDTLKRQPFAGMFSSEAGEFFSSYAFQNGNNAGQALQMLTTLTNLWDGQEIDRNTGVDRTTIENRRFNMLFLLQAEMAKDWLSNPLYSDQGFVHRLLITQSDEWDMPALDVARLPVIEAAKKQLDPFHNRIYKILSRKLNFKEGSEMELAPTMLTIEDAALQVLANFSNKIQQERKTIYRDWDGFAGRAFEHACRLAATLAAFEEKAFLDLDSAEAGVELMEFYLAQRLALELGSNSKNSQQIKVAAKVAEWLRRQEEDVAHNRLTKFGPKCYRDLTIDEREGVIKEMLN